MKVSSAKLIRKSTKLRNYSFENIIKEDRFNVSDVRTNVSSAKIHKM